MLEFYTHHGYRVIALASKSLPNVSPKRAKRLKRAEAESGLTFLGFIIFENKLKPSTTGVLAKLRDARIRRVMCTGDNILTAISVARECELVSKDGYVFVPHFREGMYLSAPLTKATRQCRTQSWRGRVCRTRG